MILRSTRLMWVWCWVFHLLHEPILSQTKLPKSGIDPEIGFSSHPYDHSLVSLDDNDDGRHLKTIRHPLRYVGRGL